MTCLEKSIIQSLAQTLVVGRRYFSFFFLSHHSKIVLAKTQQVSVGQSVTECYNMKTAQSPKICPKADK